MPGRKQIAIGSAGEYADGLVLIDATTGLPLTPASSADFTATNVLLTAIRDYVDTLETKTQAEIDLLTAGIAATIADGGAATIGAKADAEVVSAGAASLIAISKRIRTLLNGGLPTALGGAGGLITELLPSTYQTPAGGPSFSVSSAATFFTQATDTMGRWMSLQMIANASGNTVTWEGSNDGGTTWFAFGLGSVQASTGTSIATTTTSPTATFTGIVPYQRVRVRVSAQVGGTTTIACYFHSMPAPTHIVCADTELPAAAALSDTIGNPTSPMVGAAGMLWNGSQWERAKSSAVGVSRVEQVFSYSHLAANATTTIKSGAGFLHSLVINSRGVGNTATVYDNTAGSGTVIAVIDTTLSTTAFLYDVSFATGLTVVIAGGTAPDLTVCYR